MIKDKYKCQFSPDGKNWITDSIKNIDIAWEFLTGTEATKWKLFNPFGKIRIVNTKTNFIIGK